jgi:integrase
MSAANDDAFSVQQFRGGFALVWRENGKRKRRTLHSKDRQSAEAEARKLWERGDDSPWTVGRTMTAYLATIAHKPSHGRRQDAWKAMRGFWDNVDPAMIDEPMAQSYRSRRKVADATARYELMQLSTALNWAVGQGHIHARRTVWLPSAPERKTRHLDYGEWHQFFDAVKADHARLYAMIGLHTMARPTAILQLTWDRVDFPRLMIDFTPPGHIRTAKRRTMSPIASDLLPWLQQGYAARTCEHVIERGGKPVACIKKAFQAASQRSGVHATPYTLRHTGAVYAAEGGVSMAELSQFMGHDTSATTEKFYAHFSPDHLRRVANAVGNQLRGSV